jgi:DNA processing protein
MEELEALIILNSIEGVGFVKLRRLKENFGSFAKVILKTEEDLIKIEGIGKTLAGKIRDAFKEFDLKKELKLVKESKVSLVTLDDKDYPENLKEIYDPPYLLYMMGELKEADKNALAIVGSRRASYYGLSTAEKFGFSLASRGITIVSGLARGIDTSAHRGAFKSGGRTLAVLGSGLSNLYPKENKKLAEDISKNGAIISEFPMEYPPFKQNFPRRNRVISGLSKGVVVVEAAERSGALITADFALEQGREVFAIPGKVDSFTSGGTHNLIKQGAKLVTSIEDILEELKLDIFSSKEENNNSVSALALEDKEKRIFSILTDEPCYIDELMSESALTITELSNILLKLELKGLIKQLPGKMFVRK